MNTDLNRARRVHMLEDEPKAPKEFFKARRVHRYVQQPEDLSISRRIPKVVQQPEDLSTARRVHKDVQQPEDLSTARRVPKIDMTGWVKREEYVEEPIVPNELLVARRRTRKEDLDKAYRKK